MGTVTRLDEVRRARRAAQGADVRNWEDRLTRTCRYQLRAEELRAISEEVMLKVTCLTLLGLAESYEQMAATMNNMSLEIG